MLGIPNAVLQEIHDRRGYTLPSGESVSLEVAGGIGWEFARTLYETVRRERPTAVLEIGFASGISALSILTALAENGPDGRLSSIDPFQATWGRNAGVHHVERAGFAARHRLLAEMDFIALPNLLSAGERFGLIYIDGNHDFEYVMLDAFYADQLLDVGGLMAFNDCGFRPVHAALKHVPPDKRYERVDVGLPADYRGRNTLVSAERRLTGRSSADRYYRKRA